MNLTSRQKAIIETLAYFDIFDYPLTLWEVYKWLYRFSSTASVLDLGVDLEALESNGVVENSNGFYFFPNRAEIINRRLDRYCLAEKKFKIALRAAWWLRLLAGIKLAAVCNSLSYNNSRAQSDIDFFIITQPGHLWWTRLVATVWLTGLGLRRHGRKYANRICLSFYITSDHLNLADISLPPQDIYLVYWLATLAPIYSAGDSLRQFINQNFWLKNYLPNYLPTELGPRRKIFDRRIINFFRQGYQKLLDSQLGRSAEFLARRVQSSRIKKYVGSFSARQDGGVIISPSMLKIHTTDRRQYYRQKWQDKVSSILKNSI